MSVVRMQKLYCKKCDKVVEQPVLMSTNSWMIEMDPELKKRAENGTLFKNFCETCGEELEMEKEEEEK